MAIIVQQVRVEFIRLFLVFFKNFVACELEDQHLSNVITLSLYSSRVYSSTF